MMAQLVVQPAAKQYFKKLNDKRLEQLIKEAMEAILADPSIGEMKHSDLRGIQCVDIYHNKTNYELAYLVVEIDNEAEQSSMTSSEAPRPNTSETVVVVILAGTRENFYRELKRYWKLMS